MLIHRFQFTKRTHCQDRALRELGAKTGRGTPLEHKQIETKKITWCLPDGLRTRYFYGTTKWTSQGTTIHSVNLFLDNGRDIPYNLMMTFHWTDSTKGSSTTSSSASSCQLHWGLCRWRMCRVCYTTSLSYQFYKNVPCVSKFPFDHLREPAPPQVPKSPKPSVLKLRQATSKNLKK